MQLVFLRNHQTKTVTLGRTRRASLRVEGVRKLDVAQSISHCAVVIVQNGLLDQ